MNIPCFTDISNEDQVKEFESYLKSLGSDIVESTTEDEMHVICRRLVNASDIIWKNTDINDHDMESSLNALTMLILLVSPEKLDDLVNSYCKKALATPQGERRLPSRMRLLRHLFHWLDSHSSLRYAVYTSMIKLAGSFDLLKHVHPNIGELKGWIVDWNISVEQQQNLWRELYAAMVKSSSYADMAQRVMIELLGTYTEQTAVQAKEDAHKCITSSIANPDLVLLGHLLSLKPVIVLEGEPIHDLLNIFVSGNLAMYLQFCERRPDFIAKNELNHQDNIKKMQLLSFLAMAEKKEEISFEDVQQEIHLAEEEVEQFIIDVVRTKTVRALIDQPNCRIIIISTTPRTFGKQQWHILRDHLQVWQSQLDSTLGSLQSLMRR